MTSKLWKDQYGRLHDAQGKFTKGKLLQEQELESTLPEIYFSQDDEKPQTYHRTGHWVEVDDSDEIFADMMCIGLFGTIIVKLVASLF